MTNYKAKIEREELVDAIAGAIDKAIRENGLSSYDEIRSEVIDILTVYED